MQLVVTASRDGQPVSFQQASPDAALAKAHELEEAGLNEVCITDITGRSYGPGEFATCFPAANPT